MGNFVVFINWGYVAIGIKLCTQKILIEYKLFRCCFFALTFSQVYAGGTYKRLDIPKRRKHIKCSKYEAKNNNRQENRYGHPVR